MERGTRRRPYVLALIVTALLSVVLIACHQAQAGPLQTTKSSVVTTPNATVAPPATATTLPTATEIPATATSTPVPPSPTPSPRPRPTATATALSVLDVPILMYHNFNDQKDIYSVRPEVFRAQLKALKAAGYTPVTMRQIADAFDRGAPLPEHPLAITMDDARATQKTAIQILKDEGYTATLFVPSGWHELPESYVVALDHQGFDIESHTVWHADLARTPNKITEIGQGQKTLEKWLGRPVDGFAYPFGHYLPQDLVELHRLGFRYALTIRQSVVLRANERYQWPRLLVTNYQPANLLARINYLMKQAHEGKDPPAPASFNG